ncbi:MAG TPA: hypothetical protein VN654_30160 [Vicinamibacterales bacterium]|nr:hypothetical protein [Vicinamibacterales bacterium]
MSLRNGVLSVAACVLFAAPALAQNWSFDARKVALGSPGSGGNLASDMIADENDYRSIVLPFGLFQVFRDFDRLNPTNDNFDVIRTAEYAASPLHFTFGRNALTPGQSSRSTALNQFVTDIRDANLSTDLNRYRGLAPSNQPRAEGLMSPSFGGTIKVKKGPGSAFHGVYVGAGPYIGMQTDVNFDQKLINVLGSETNVYYPNDAFRLDSTGRGQMALAVIGGYRGRFALPSSSSDRDGVYVAANYNYLHGFRYEDVNLALRLDTDRNGLLAVNPFLPSPLLVTRDNATSGTGRAVDVGVGLVMNRWEGGFGVNGIANRINWTNVERTTYSLGNPFLGDSDFVESFPTFVGDRQLTLPVDVRGNVGYRADKWTAVGEAGKGYGGKSLHGGYEYRFSALAVRGGAIYARQMWNPSAGVGINMSQRVALDVAMYGNATNVERKRHPALAVSLRFNH